MANVIRTGAACRQEMWIIERMDAQKRGDLNTGDKVRILK